MQVFIVSVESEREGVFCWDVDKIFSTMDSAKAYVAERQSEYRSSRFPQLCPEYDIETEEVYA